MNMQRMNIVNKLSRWGLDTKLSTVVTPDELLVELDLKKSDRKVLLQCLEVFSRVTTIMSNGNAQTEQNIHQLIVGYVTKLNKNSDFDPTCEQFAKDLGLTRADIPQINLAFSAVTGKSFAKVRENGEAYYQLPALKKLRVLFLSIVEHS